MVSPRLGKIDSYVELRRAEDTIIDAYSLVMVSRNCRAFDMKIHLSGTKLPLPRL